MSDYHAIAGDVAEFNDADDARDLIPGNPDTIGESGTAMARLGKVMAYTGDALGAIETSNWTGQAADAFRDRIAGKPTQWYDAGQGLTDIAEALTEYCAVLVGAQAEAGRALDQWRAAKDATTKAVQDHNQRVTAHNNAIDAGQNPGQPPVFTDPSTDRRKDAERILADARRKVTEAGYACGRVISDWIGRTPAEPDWWDRLGMDLSDGVQFANTQVTDLVEGVGEGLAGMTKMTRAVNPYDPYNLAHPEQYVANMQTLVTGIGHAVTHPKELATTLLDADTWRDSPSKAIGKLLPDAALGALTGGTALAGRLAGRTVLKATADSATGGLLGLGEAGLAGTRRLGGLLGRQGDNLGQAGRRTPDAENTSRTTADDRPWHHAERYPDTSTQAATTQAADAEATGRFTELGRQLDGIGGSLRARIDELADWAASKHPDATTPSSVHPTTTQPPVRQPPQVGQTRASSTTTPQHAEPPAPPAGQPPRAADPVPPPAPAKFDVQDWQRRAREVMEQAKASDAVPKPDTSSKPSPDALQRQMAAREYAQQHGVSLAEAQRVNAHREVTVDGHYVERRTAPEPPPRPVEINRSYLQEVIDQNQAQLADNLPRVENYPGMAKPDFAPGQLELPGGLSRDMPPGALDDVATPIDPRGIHLDQPGQPVVWRQVDDWLAQDAALWRMDDRPPKTLFDGDGLAPRDPTNLQVGHHVGIAGRGDAGDAFVSFSTSPEHTVQRNQRLFGEHGHPIAMPDGTHQRVQYIYEAYHPNGIDTNASYHDLALDSGHKEGEILMPGGVPSSHIYRVWPRITHFDEKLNLIGSTLRNPIINKKFNFLDEMRMRSTS